LPLLPPVEGDEAGGVDGVVGLFESDGLLEGAVLDGGELVEGDAEGDLSPGRSPSRPPCGDSWHPVSSPVPRTSTPMPISNLFIAFFLLGRRATG
jgi:hypothetical protein